MLTFLASKLCSPPPPALLAFASRCCERTTRTSNLAGLDPVRSSELVVLAGTKTLSYSNARFRCLILETQTAEK